MTSRSIHQPPPEDADSMAILRRAMVETQLRQHGLRDARVLTAMGRVPREEFVPVSLRRFAYDDSALPISYGQTISQPYTVAFMCEAAQLNGGENVLEIGTGSGYGAAVLSELAQHVDTMERVDPLAEEAQLRLERLGYRNVSVYAENGIHGLPARAPYDAIIVTAGAHGLPQAYVDQLAEAGRVVIPIGDDPFSQIMWRYVKRGGELTREDLGTFAFVPLIGERGWFE